MPLVFILIPSGRVRTAQLQETASRVHGAIEMDNMEVDAHRWLWDLRLRADSGPTGVVAVGIPTQSAAENIHLSNADLRTRLDLLPPPSGIFPTVSGGAIPYLQYSGTSGGCESAPSFPVGCEGGRVAYTGPNRRGVGRGFL